MPVCARKWNPARLTLPGRLAVPACLGAPAPVSSESESARGAALVEWSCTTGSMAPSIAPSAYSLGVSLIAPSIHSTLPHCPQRPTGPRHASQKAGEPNLDVPLVCRKRAPADPLQLLPRWRRWWSYARCCHTVGGLIAPRPRPEKDGRPAAGGTASRPRPAEGPVAAGGRAHRGRRGGAGRVRRVNRRPPGRRRPAGLAAGTAGGGAAGGHAHRPSACTRAHRHTGGSPKA